MRKEHLNSGFRLIFNRDKVQTPTTLRVLPDWFCSIIEVLRIVTIQLKHSRTFTLLLKNPNHFLRFGEARFRSLTSFITLSMPHNKVINQCCGETLRRSLIFLFATQQYNGSKPVHGIKTISRDMNLPIQVRHTRFTNLR